MTTVLKLGGELLEDAGAVRSAAQAIVRLAATTSLIVVHGGGRAIDAELRARGESPRFVDGLRITDPAALDTVVSVLAGRTNTTLVAAIGAAGGRAVGLTGADGRIGLSRRAAPLPTVSGELADLGLVGEPEGTDASLLTDLVGSGWIPVVASIGVDADGVLLNVNADVLAAHLAAVVPADRLVVAGGTAGVLDAEGRTVPELAVDAIDAMMASGVAHSGMVAKLGACRLAFTSGVADISIVAGRGAIDFTSAPGTRLRRSKPGERRQEDEGDSRRGGSAMTTATSSVMALETEHVLQVYKRNPVVFERGRGCYLFDADGRGYLDLLSGIGVAALGHANPRLAAAIAEQAATLVHTSNLYFHPLQGEVAARLADLSGLPRAFLCNSGTEAIEACLKFARRYWHAQKDSRRTGFVAFEHSFHGRTMGSLSITWDEHYRAPFVPLLSGVQFISRNDPDGLLAAVTESTGAVILEPLQGEGGVRPFSQHMADAVTEACRRTGALLIADEIQCGLGRTGRPFYSEALGLTPDLMAVGKALGAGVPIAAALLSERVAKAASFGDHGSTYGGNLLACRAALVFLEELIDRDLIGHVATVGAHLERGLRAIAARHAMVREVRGAGLIWGLDLDRPALPIVEAALDLGLLVNRTSDTVVRLLPPFVITEAEVDEACALLGRAFDKVAEGKAS